MTNLFNDPRGQRGSYLFMMQIHEIYAIINKRLQSTQGRTNFDIDAVCQSICVEIEKHQGIYPNIEKRGE